MNAFVSFCRESGPCFVLFFFLFSAGIPFCLFQGPRDDCDVTTAPYINKNLVYFILLQRRRRTCTHRMYLFCVNGFKFHLFTGKQ